MTRMTNDGPGMPLEVFIKAGRMRVQKLPVQVVEIHGQGIVPWRDSQYFSLQLAVSHRALLARLSNYKPLVMTVVDRDRPTIRWVFQCSMESMGVVTITTNGRKRQVVSASFLVVKRD